MGFDQYHEPPEELSKEARTFARMCASLTEEAEAIGWYEQRISVETDKDAKAIMENAQKEEILSIMPAFITCAFDCFNRPAMVA